MKTASVKEPSIISVDEIEKPTLGSGDILVQMHACGICGSDVEKVFGSYGQPSMRLGHEPAGVVLDVGTNVTEFKKVIGYLLTIMFLVMIVICVITAMKRCVKNTLKLIFLHVVCLKNMLCQHGMFLMVVF